MTLTTQVRLLGADPIKVESVMNQTDDVSLKHMERAMNRAVRKIQSEAQRIAPVQTGVYKRSINRRVVRISNNVLGEVYSDDNPKADYIELGTGIHRQGGGPRRMIRPRNSDVLAIPVSTLAVGRRGSGTGGVIFTKKSKGMRGQNVFARARRATRPLVTPIFNEAKQAAAAELRRKL